MNDTRAKLNDWFLSLSEGRRIALMQGDRWMLADAAYEAALTSASKQAGGEPSDEAILEILAAWHHNDQRGPIPDTWAVSSLRQLFSAAPQTHQAETLPEDAAQPFYDLAWKSGARRTVSFAGDELESVSFAPLEFEAFCIALKAVQPSQRNGGCGNGESAS